MTSRTGHCPQGRGTGQQVPPSASAREEGAQSASGPERRRVPPSVPGLSLSEAASVWSGVSQSCFPNNTSRVFIKQNMIMILAAHSRKDLPTGTHLGSRHRGWGTHGAERPHTTSPGSAGRAGGGWRGTRTPVLWRVSLLTRHCSRAALGQQPGALQGHRALREDA